MSARPLRVAIIVANVAPRYGGPAHAALAYAEALASAGAEVRVITTNQDGKGRLDVPVGRLLRAPEGYDIAYYRPGRWLGSRPSSFAFARGIFAGMRWADVAHVSSLYLPHNVYVHMTSAFTCTPYIIRPHGTLEHYQRQFSVRTKRVFDHVIGTRYIRGASAFHFTSASEAQAARDITHSIPAFITPIPINIPEECANVADNSRVLFLGRITAKKRLDLLIDAWPMVRACHPEAVLVIAGPVDPDQLHLFESLPPGIERIGLVNGSKKAEILLSSGLFVLPSLNENFGVAVAEAMAYGLPVLVTDQVALAEQVRKYHAGEVLTCPTADGLAVALNSWLSRPDARTVAGAAARSMIETSFSTTTVGNTLTSLIAPLAFVESHDS